MSDAAQSSAQIVVKDSERATPAKRSGLAEPLPTSAQFRCSFTGSNANMRASMGRYLSKTRLVVAF